VAGLATQPGYAFAMKRQPNLVRRRNTFYFRARVPVALVVRVGRSELWRSLRTTDPGLARLRAWRLAARLEQLWVSVRRSVTQEQIDQLIREWLREQLAFDKVTRTDIAFAEGHEHPGESQSDAAARMLMQDAEDSLFEWRDTVARSDWQKAALEVNALLAGRGIQLPRDSDPYRLLCLGMCVALRQYHGIRIDRSNGRWGDDLGPFAGGPIETPAPAGTALVPAGGPTLEKAAEDFLDEKSRLNRLKPKRKMELQAALNLLCRHLGRSKPLRTVGRSEVGGLRSLLTKLPSNFTKKFGDRPLEEIAAEAPRMGLQPLRPETINQKYLGIFETFFGWCVEGGQIEENPASGIKVKVGRSSHTDQGRGTFNLEELQKIFAAPLFIGCKSRSRVYDPGSFKVRDHRYWIPVLGLFTGARLNELCQLETHDIKEIDGVLCLDIAPTAEKSVKTQAGIRRVPIHPGLLQLGFRLFVDEMQGDGAHRLFPEIEVGRGGYLSENVSKWFGRFLETTLGEELVDARRLVFHSFRHCMKDALRAAGVEERIQDQLLGHESGHVSGDYGEGYKPPRLFEEISKVKFEGLDLSRLHSGIG